MPVEAIMEAHVEADLKREAEIVLAAAGVTFDDMVRRMLESTVESQCVPLDFFRPNAKTVAAMEAARRGEFAGSGSIDDLFKELDADD